MPPKILLVGTGVTSAVTGLFLRSCIPQALIVVWDKAKGIGGRMSTSRSSSDNSCIADLGAQYISTTEEIIKNNYDIYEPLFTERIIEPMKCNVVGMKESDSLKNFVTPYGMSSVVKCFLKKAEINEICFEHHITEISQVSNKWFVRTTSGTKNYFDIIILTMPVPQILELEGNIKNILSENSNILTDLQSVEYSSRYALGLFYSEPISATWDAQYINGDIFRYVAVDNKKRNRSEDACAVVFHTSVEYGRNHLNSPLPTVQSELMSHVEELFPEWPRPKAVKCHKWKYSQVLKSYPGAPGYIVISGNPLLIAGGDGFVGSNFDNCITSAKSIVNEVKRCVYIKAEL